MVRHFGRLPSSRWVFVAKLGKMDVDGSNGEKTSMSTPRGIAITLHIRQELRTRLVTYYLVVWGLKISRLGRQFHGDLVSWNQSSLLNESLTNDVMPKTNTPVHSITDQQGSLFSLQKSFYTIICLQVIKHVASFLREKPEFLAMCYFTFRR